MTTLRNQILATIRVLGAITLDDIAEHLDAQYDDVAAEVCCLVRGGLLRSKDSDMDHDWVYLLTAAGRESM